MIRTTFLLIALVHSVWAEGFEDWRFSGNIGPESQIYLERPDGRYSSSNGIAAELETVIDQDAWYFRSWLKGFKDFREEERDFIRFDELYGMYRADYWEASLGGRIFFWGALEVNHIVDVLNPRDSLYDPLDSDFKKGVNVFTASYFFNESQLDFILKSGESNTESNDPESPYYFAGGLPYEDELDASKGEWTPSAYLKYSGYTDWEYPLDYAFAVVHGYDNQRFFSVNNDSELQQHAYRANQFLMWHTWVVDTTLLKLEAKVADVIDEPRVSDYLQLGIGVEHTLEQLFDGNDLGLIAEYYTHHEFDDDAALDRDALFVVFQNDLFLGCRLTFNDIASTEIVGGGIFDLEHNGEQSWYVEYQRRLFDTYLLEADVRYVEPGDDATRFAALQRHTRFKISLKYHF